VLALERVSSAPHITRFTSHVSFVTPSGGYSHGVGDVAPRFNSRLPYGNYGVKPSKRPRYGGWRSFQSEIVSTKSIRNNVNDVFINFIGLPTKSIVNIRDESSFRGYLREKPSIPFTYPSSTHGHSTSTFNFGNSAGTPLKI
jgi:hypothetical protein